MDTAGGMTVREAGRKGGTTTAQRYGHEFYEEIGRKGGAAVAAKHGHEHYERIGKMGGAEVRRINAAGRAALGLAPSRS